MRSPPTLFSPSFTKRDYKKSSRLQVIVEDDIDSARSPENLLIDDLKHYSRTTEVPSKLRAGILSTNLSAFIRQYPHLITHDKNLPTINNVFLQLYRINYEDCSQVLHDEVLIQLFESTAKSLLKTDSYALPPFMALLAQYFLQDPLKAPAELYALVVDLGASLKFASFGDALSAVATNANGNLPDNFLNSILSYFHDKNRLEVQKFEDIVAFATRRDMPGLLNDDLVTFLIKYVEEVFENSPPNVHEFKDQNKNVYRIQQLTEALVHSTQNRVSPSAHLKLLKFYTELNYVVESPSYSGTVQKQLQLLLSHDYQLIHAALLGQDLFDESVCEIFVLHLVASDGSNPELIRNLLQSIASDDVKYSASMRMQATFAQFLCASKANGSDDEKKLSETAKLVYSPFLESGHTETMEQRITQLCMASGLVRPRGAFMEQLNADFLEQFNHEPNYLSFVYRLDKAVDIGNSDMALGVFQESLNSSSVQWESIQDPNVQLALNKLIALVSEKEDDIMTIFPIFRKIKSYMSSQCNAEALKQLAIRMLEKECVGDVIEMLKRELPVIDPETTKQIPTLPAYAYSHRALYNTLQEFVLNYTNEESFETNWVLYGELHKYFQIPFDSYLPTMKFFCDKNRLHAALVVFRRVKSQNEKHGNHLNPPPLREMYMYLLKTFGDQLYEEGVMELHEYLNMDISLQDTDIDLQNCLLDAYSNLQNVGKARDLFLSISSNSKEEGGANEETVRIMIKTYTYTDMLYVRKFWNNLSLLGIFPNYDIFKQYVIAHVYHGCVEDAFQLIEEIDDYNLQFSPDLLLAMHNYCLNPDKQLEVVEWARENHNDEWQEVSQSSLLRKASQYVPDTSLLASGEGE